MSTQNQRVSSFISRNITAAAHSACVGSMMFPVWILWIWAFSNSRVIGSVWYGAEFTGAVSGWSSLIRCFTLLLQLRRPFLMNYNCDNMSVNRFWSMILHGYYDFFASVILQLGGNVLFSSYVLVNLWLSIRANIVVYAFNYALDFVMRRLYRFSSYGFVFCLANSGIFVTKHGMILILGGSHWRLMTASR